MTADPDIEVVTTKELSQRLGVTDRRIRQLEEEGVLEKFSRGRWDLWESVRSYIEYLREKRSEGPPSLEEAKARYWSAKAEREARSNQEEARNSIRLDQTERALQKFVMHILKGLANVSRRAAPKCPQHGGSIPLIEKEIQGELDRVLRQLSEVTVVALQDD